MELTAEFASSALLSTALESDLRDINPHITNIDLIENLVGKYCDVYFILLIDNLYIMVVIICGEKYVYNENQSQHDLPLSAVTICTLLHMPCSCFYMYFVLTYFNDSC